MIKIPRSLEEYQKSMAISKKLLERMIKGQEFLEKAYEDKSFARVFEAAKLYGELAFKLNEELENALFMHECATTGQTVMMSRKGKLLNIDKYIQGEAEEVDLWTIKSMKLLKETFGEDAIVDVEFEWVQSK